MITVNNLVKSYGDKKVLNGLNGSFEENKIHGILGPNGCGKTTFIKSMLGLVQADSGTVQFHGVDLKDCREMISWLPQHPEAPLNTTPAKLFNLIQGLRSAPAKYLEELIREFEFQSEMNKPLKTLSGGNNQKCFLIATLMFDVPFIILDEPTVGLDPVAAALFKKIIRQRKNKSTILLISHITSEIQQLADQFHFLLDGKWVYQGNHQDLTIKTGLNDFESALVHTLSVQG